MRRIVMFNQVSADGFFAAPDGGLDWVAPDEELDREAVERLPATDAILLGRRTYELFAAFWPHALDDPETARDPHGPASSPEIRAIAVWLNETPKLVVSRTLTDPAWGPARVLRDLDPDAIRALKREPGRDVIVFGSGSVVTQLTTHGLIDEYRLVVSPILLGSGRRLLDEGSAGTTLELDGATAHRSGNVVLRYRRGVPRS
jgi:dihydrofolate reductase